MDHEKNIQSQQTQTATQIRLQSPDENSRRPEGHSPTAQSRPKRARRLKKRAEFQSFKKGTRLAGRFLCIDFKESTCFAFGITASCRYGNSPERNRFKRIVREAIRTSLPLLPETVELHILPRQKAKGAKMQELQEEILQLTSHFHP